MGSGLIIIDNFFYSVDKFVSIMIIIKIVINIFYFIIFFFLVGNFNYVLKNLFFAIEIGIINTPLPSIRIKSYFRT